MHFYTLHKILNILNNKLEPHRLSIPEIIHSEKRSYLNA